jgi:hypothetical protein
MGRYQKINPFGTITEEEVVSADIQKTKKKAITKQAPMEEKDVEISGPMSAEDVKELWRDWRERKKAKKEAILKGK